MEVARSRPQSLACLMAVLLAGCGGAPDGNRSATPSVSPAASGQQAPPPAPSPVFDDPSSGVSIGPVPGMQLRRDFSRSYLAGDGWKADAEDGSAGTPVVALVMDGSNEVTAAELRIGRSDDAGAVAGCETVPGHAEPAGGEAVVVDGVPFRRFAWSDAAMSHYMEVEAYRAVRDGQCLAIDLLLTGTRPEVYDPPRPPPFGRDQAWTKLREALAAVRFGG